VLRFGIDQAVSTPLPTSVPTPVVTNPVAASNGYLYGLFKRIGATEFQARTGEFLLLGPLRIICIVVVAIVSARVGSAVIRKSIMAFRSRAPIRVRSPRTDQRARTIADVMANGWRVVVGVIAALMVLAEGGVNLGPLLAGAGIAGLAIAFGAQALIRDYLSGAFMLLEDQYGVGDVVTIGTATGTVEDLNLRTTRLRSADGTVWFIPNGEIRQVGNQSMEWSRAIVEVTVAYDNDIPAVMASLSEVAADFAIEPAWSKFVLEPPELQGVQAMGVEGVTIRLVVKTAPREQWSVARELRGRITERMRKDNVRGPGRTVVVSSGVLDLNTPPPPPSEPQI
jgi:moderate conductance mechanosensitive channel